MEKFYSQKFIASFLCVLQPAKIDFARKKFIALFLLFGLFGFPASVFSQKLNFSYSYLNITRGNGGGTLEQSDIIEVRALVKVNATTSNFYYIDTMRPGTQYVTNSMKIITNEGLLFQGPYTNAALDDNGVYATTGGLGRIRVNLGTGLQSRIMGLQRLVLIPVAEK